MSRLTTSLIAAAVALAVAPVVAQGQPEYTGEPVASGVSYYRFAEVGAPTFEVVFIGNGVRGGIYRFEQGTSLLRALALAGGVVPSDSTARQVSTTTIRVLRPRPQGGVGPIYETTYQQFVDEVLRHPDLRDGDLVETQVTVTLNEERDRFTFLDGLNVAARVASLATALYILFTGRR